MKHNNIFQTLTVAIAVMLLSSACTFEQEDLFSESAAQRIMTTNKNLQNQLVEQSADDKYGWVIQYFVQGTDVVDVEGFNLFGRFYSNGKVMLAGDHRYLRNGNAGNYTEDTSIYQINSEEGTVLSFATWNDIITVFADPVDPTQAPDVIVSDGEGMNGDYNLVLNQNNGDEITFWGERHRYEARFLKCDRPWKEYITACADLKKKIANKYMKSYYVTDSKDTTFFVGLNTGVVFHVDRVVDPLSAFIIPCVFSPNGFRLAHTDSIGDCAFKEFTLDAENGRLLSQDQKVQVIPCWDNYVVNCADNTQNYWRIMESGMTDEQKSLLEQMETEIKKVNNSYTLDSIALGRPTENNVMTPALLVCAHYTTTKMGKEKVFTAKPYIYTNTYKSAFGQMTIGQSSRTDVSKDMAVFSSTNLKSLVDAFAATIYGTYAIKPNDYFLPATCVLEPTGSEKAITLNLGAK